MVWGSLFLLRREYPSLVHGEGYSISIQAGLLTFVSIYSLRLPGEITSDIQQLSSSITAAGPFLIFTGFPIKLFTAPECRFPTFNFKSMSTFFSGGENILGGPLWRLEKCSPGSPGELNGHFQFLANRGGFKENGYVTAIGSYPS